MGITIHYKGKLNNPDLLNTFCDEIKDIAKDMNWSFNTFDNDLNKPSSSYLDKNGNIKGHIPIKGLNVTIHPKAESLSFLFDKNGNLRNLLVMTYKNWNESEVSNIFIKTQFVPIETHITIIKLLEYIKKKYISNLEVIDEGNYWETRDKNILEEKLSFLNKEIDQIGNIISEIIVDGTDSPEAILRKIENVLNKKIL